MSKNCVLEHVGRQRPFESTGRLGGQVEHWLNEVPEQVAQSGWQGVHVPEVVIELDGQEETHLPPEASWPPLQVRQKSAAPMQVPH